MTRPGPVSRILILEDEPADAELTRRHLAKGGLAFSAVVADSRPAFTRQLTEFRPDVILADYTLPGFSAEDALEAARQSCPEVPFIVLSGAIGDDAAVELIRRGATDFVLKDRPARLVPVVMRAVEEARQRARLAQMEARFHRSQRLASVGRLAGGIAQEFNNQVGVMVNCAGFIREQAERATAAGAGPEAWDGVARDAEQIELAGERITKLVYQLLTAGAQHVLRNRPVNLHEVVAGSERALRSVLGGRIGLSLAAEPGLWQAIADPDQIREVLLALAANAREAMPGGGTFSVTVGNVRLDGADAGEPPDLWPGEYVRLAATDTGVGMEPQVAEHAFEPYFTTKPLVAGGGLGLATVYGIISRAGGAVDIASAPGEGTTVTVWLPRAEA